MCVDIDYDIPWDDFDEDDYITEDMILPNIGDK